MRKTLAVLLIAFVGAISCIYIFIPPKLLISKSVFISMPANAAYRHFANDASWANWWLFKDSVTDPGFRLQDNELFYNGYRFHCSDVRNNAVGITISHDSVQAPGSLNALSVGVDSSLILWECSLETGPDPISRVTSYLEARRLKESMTAIMRKFSAFISLPVNVYGIQIETTSTTDTLLIVGKHKTALYPTVQEIYSFLEPIKNYIYSQGALSTGYPMMNVTKSADFASFTTTVALPVNKVLKNHDSLSLIHMVPGFFLTATVKGGPFTLEHEMKQLHYYMQDHQQTNMAMPFEILVTDRRLESDTLNWVTRLYLPVMH